MTNDKEMTRQYSIADHLIEISAPDGSVLWEVCTNYAPFELDGKGAGTQEPLCRLEITDELEIPEVTHVYTSAEKGFPRLEISRFDGGWTVKMAPNMDAPEAALLLSDENFHNVRLRLLSGSGTAMRFALDNSMMLAFALASAPLGTMEIHSSVTVCDGRGYSFLGKSGTGKSTHSRLWRENIPGSTLLNDDNPVIRIKDGQARIYGTPWSGKTPCYKAESVPLAAVVRIRQSPENKIRRLSPIEAYASLYSSCSAFREVKGTSDGIHDTLSRLAALVPMYTLDCRPDAEAALLCHSSVSER